MKSLTLFLATAAVLVVATTASGRPLPHHRHQVCSMHGHRRVCVWR